MLEIYFTAQICCQLLQNRMAATKSVLWARLDGLLEMQFIQGATTTARFLFLLSCLAYEQTTNIRWGWSCSSDIQKLIRRSRLYLCCVLSALGLCHQKAFCHSFPLCTVLRHVLCWKNDPESLLLVTLCCHLLARWLHNTLGLVQMKNYPLSLKEKKSFHSPDLHHCIS